MIIQSAGERSGGLAVEMTMAAGSRFAGRNPTATNETKEDGLDFTGRVVGTAAVKILAESVPAGDSSTTPMVQAFAALPKHLP